MNEFGKKNTVDITETNVFVFDDNTKNQAMFNNVFLQFPVVHISMSLGEILVSLNVSHFVLLCSSTDAIVFLIN